MIARFRCTALVGMAFISALTLSACGIGLVNEPRAIPKSTTNDSNGVGVEVQAPTNLESANVYFLRNGKLEPRARALNLPSDTPRVDVVSTILRELEKGPNAVEAKNGFTSAIPLLVSTGSKPIIVSLIDHGVATVNLDVASIPSALSSGSPSSLEAVAQLVYTVVNVRAGVGSVQLVTYAPVEPVVVQPAATIAGQTSTSTTAAITLQRILLAPTEFTVSKRATGVSDPLSQDDFPCLGGDPLCRTNPVDNTPSSRIADTTVPPQTVPQIQGRNVSLNRRSHNLFGIVSIPTQSTGNFSVVALRVEVAPGSSKGRTSGFGPENGGSNPSPGTTHGFFFPSPGFCSSPGET
jgi:Sporulation and spore germination